MILTDALPLTTAQTRYSCFTPSALFTIQTIERHWLAHLADQGLTDLSQSTILEVGCGWGYWLRAFVTWGAAPERVKGIELLPARAAAARRLCPSAVEIQSGNAALLPYADRQFDLVLQSVVFSSILNPTVRRAAAADMLRVLKPGGRILWYDFFVDNPRNQHVRGVRYAEIQALFPGCLLDLQRVTLAPPLARALVPWSWPGCAWLERLRVLNTHYLGSIRRRV